MENTSLKRICIEIVVICLSANISEVYEATSWTGASSDSLTDAGNWDNGLPTLANLGTITSSLMSTVNTSISSMDLTLNGTADIHSGNQITNINSGSILTLAGSAVLNTRGDRNVSFNASTFNIQDSAYFAKRDVTLSNTSSGLISGGNFISRKLTLYSTTYNISGGTIIINSRDGSTSSPHLDIDGSSAINFTLNSSGVITWDGMNATGVTNVLAEIDTYLDDGRIKINGSAITGGSANLGNYFSVTQTPNVSNTDINLQLIPEPSSIALLGLASISFLLRRKH